MRRIDGDAGLHHEAAAASVHPLTDGETECAYAINGALEIIHLPAEIAPATGQFAGQSRPMSSENTPSSGPAAAAGPAPKIGFVSLGCPKALTDSELILTQLRAEGYDTGARDWRAEDIERLLHRRQPFLRCGKVVGLLQPDRGSAYHDTTAEPHPDYVETYRRLRDDALADPDGFWAREAADLPWLRPWDTVLDWRPPHAKWRCLTAAPGYWWKP